MPPNPFQEGQAFQQDLLRRRSIADLTREQAELAGQRRQARNALAEMFGPAAADPTGFANASNVELRGRQLDLREEGQAFEQDLTNTELRDRTALGAVRGMAQQLQAGRDPEEVFNRFAPRVIAIDPNTDLEQFRSVFLQDPQGFLTETNAILQARLGALGGSDDDPFIGNPVPVIDEQGNERLLGVRRSGATEILSGPGGGSLAPANAVFQAGRLDVSRGRLGLSERQFFSERAEAIQKRQAFLSGTTNAANTVVRDIETILDVARDAGTFQGENTTLKAILRKTKSELLPGSPEREINKLLDSVKSNIGIDALLRIKQSGAGLGQVPQSQLETLQEILGNLDVERDPRFLIRDLRDALVLYEGILAQADQETLRNLDQLDELREEFDIEERGGAAGPQAQPENESENIQTTPAPQGAREGDIFLQSGQRFVVTRDRSGNLIVVPE